MSATFLTARTSRCRPGAGATVPDSLSTPSGGGGHPQLPHQPHQAAAVAIPAEIHPPEAQAGLTHCPRRPALALQSGNGAAEGAA